MSGKEDSDKEWPSEAATGAEVPDPTLLRRFKQTLIDTLKLEKKSLREVDRRVITNEGTDRERSRQPSEYKVDAAQERLAFCHERLDPAITAINFLLAHSGSLTPQKLIDLLLSNYSVFSTSPNKSWLKEIQKVGDGSGLIEFLSQPRLSQENFSALAVFMACKENFDLQSILLISDEAELLRCKAELVDRFKRCFPEVRRTSAISSESDIVKFINAKTLAQQEIVNAKEKDAHYYERTTTEEGEQDEFGGRSGFTYRDMTAAENEEYRRRLPTAKEYQALHWLSAIQGPLNQEEVIRHYQKESSDPLQRAQRLLVGLFRSVYPTKKIGSSTPIARELRTIDQLIDKLDRLKQSLLETPHAVSEKDTKTQSRRDQLESEISEIRASIKQSIHAFVSSHSVDETGGVLIAFRVLFSAPDEREAVVQSSIDDPVASVSLGLRLLEDIESQAAAPLVSSSVAAAPAATEFRPDGYEGSEVGGGGFGAAPGYEHVAPAPSAPPESVSSGIPADARLLAWAASQASTAPVNARVAISALPPLDFVAVPPPPVVGVSDEIGSQPRTAQAFGVPPAPHSALQSDATTDLINAFPSVPTHSPSSSATVFSSSNHPAPSTDGGSRRTGGDLLPS